jgi:fatty-acyl-CoA synthase
LGVPLAGAVIHTLNLRLHPDDIAFIASDAGDRWLIVDECLLPLLEKFRARAPFERIFVIGVTTPPPSRLEDYETLLANAPEVALPTLTELQPLGMCYTSGTTGKPKGVVYTHRSTLLHTLTTALPDALGISRSDTLLPVVPMFHVNAWGLPYVAALVGAKQVYPGPHLDPVSVLDLMAGEQVTIAAGVPTVWMGIRDALDAQPGHWRLRPGIRMVVGGSAAPEQLIRDFDRQGLTLLHAWGMTETSPIGTVSRLAPEMATLDENERYRLRGKQGSAVPFVDLRVRNEAGDVPADGKTAGELQVRGPWIASRYHNDQDPERWTSDGFFRTGDVANIDRHGFVQLVDRTADLIKSGGEWIASVELENALMGHPAVREAAVVGAPHPRWSERPIAAVVLKAGASASDEELRAFLAAKFVKYWLPDAFVFMDAIPRTSAGKFKKTELRERFKDWKW